MHGPTNVKIVSYHLLALCLIKSEKVCKEKRVHVPWIVFSVNKFLLRAQIRISCNMNTTVFEMY
jgi:hypothetical protein